MRGKGGLQGGGQTTGAAQTGGSAAVAFLDANETGEGGGGGSEQHFYTSEDGHKSGSDVRDSNAQSNPGQS